MRTVEDGNTYKAVQSGTITHYWDNNYTVNATKVGSPTVTNKAIVSGLSKDDYYTQSSINMNVGGLYLPFELVFKVYGYSTSHSNPLCSKNSSQSWLSKIVVTTSGAVQVSLSNNNSSWNVCNFTTSNTILNNTWVWIKIKFDGTAYVVTYSTDNENWTELGRQTTGNHYGQNLSKLFSCNDTGSSGLKAGYGGQIDLKECYCIIGDNRVWDGAYISSRTEVTSSEPYDYTTTENVYKCWGSAPETIFESSTGGSYTVNLEATGNYEITCVGGGGAAAMRGVYDDKGYGWGGGSGGAFKGIFELNAGSYTVVVGSANNNTTAQSGNTQTLNPTDTTTHDSYVQGVVTCGGGGSGHYNTNYVGAAGAAPVFSIMPESTTINSAGNAGLYNSGGKGSAAAATCAGGASVYLEYGRGQGCRTSEYASKRSWINGTNGYVRIRRMY